MSKKQYSFYASLVAYVTLSDKELKILAECAGNHYEAPGLPLRAASLSAPYYLKD